MPGKCIQFKYEKEYGVDTFEIQETSIQRGQKVLVVDDLLATGGSAHAAESLVSSLGGKVIQHLFVIELADLKGRDVLDAPVRAMLNL